MATSYFQKLPRELRDRIYAYVLTATHDLALEAGADGVSRICERQESISRPTLLSKDRWPLLRAVRRIRDAYCCVLGYRVRRLSFNQIQFVNHLFYEETHGLEYRYNTIFFEDGNNRTAAQRCRQILNHPAAQKYGRYLRASIRGSQTCIGSTSDAECPLSLLDFCRLYPTACLRLHNPLWTQADPRFVLVGLSYSAIVRNLHETSLCITSRTTVFSPSEMGAWRAGLLSDKVPENFRLFPYEAELNAAVLLDACRRSLVLQEEDLPLWVDLAKVWFKYGI